MFCYLNVSFGSLITSVGEERAGISAIEYSITEQKLPQICTLHIVKMGEIWVGIKLIKGDNFHYFFIKSYVVDVY